MCLLAGTEDGQIVFLDPPCENNFPGHVRAGHVLSTERVTTTTLMTWQI